MRILISGLWMFLGTDQRSDSVKPCHTVQLHRLKMSARICSQCRTPTTLPRRKQLMVVSVVVAFFVILRSSLLQRDPVIRENAIPCLGPVSIAALTFNRSSDYHTGSTEFQHSCFLFCKYCAGLLLITVLCTVFPPVLSEEAWINRRIIPRKPLMRSNTLVDSASRPDHCFHRQRAKYYLCFTGVLL